MRGETFFEKKGPSTCGSTPHTPPKNFEREGMGRVPRNEACMLRGGLGSGFALGEGVTLTDVVHLITKK